MADAVAPVTFTTPLFRASYPNLDKPSKMEGSSGDPKFGITGLYTATTFTPADAERWKKMRQAAVLSLREKFGAKAFDPTTKKILPAYKMPFRDGMEKPDKDGYGAGVTFIRMGNKNPPGMIQVLGGQKVKVDHSKFYPGCFCRATVNFWAFDNKSKGVAVNLYNLMFIGDGERFGNQGPDAENDFTDLGDDEISFGDEGSFGDSADDEIEF